MSAGHQDIVILTADYPPIEGGIATVTLEVARELARIGRRVTVVAPAFADMEAFDAAEPYRVVRYRGYGLGWLRLIPMAWASRELLRTASLVLAINVASGGVVATWARVVHRVPFITFAYAYEFLKFDPRSPFAYLLRMVYRRAAAVVAISRYSRDRLLAFGAPSHNLHIVLPGAPLARSFTGEELAAVRQKYALDAGPVILGVGRFVRRKGHLTLVRAMPAILERVPNAQLIIVGRGPMMSAVAREAHTLGVRDHVVLPGRLDDTDVAALYATCDVFAMPAGADGPQVEGFGLVYAEAHAYGKPVVAGDSGGVPDAVLAGTTGLLVPPEQAPATAEAIVQLLSNAPLAERIGAAGRTRVEKELNWRTFTQRILAFVEQSP